MPIRRTPYRPGHAAAPAIARSPDASRPNANERGYTAEWARYRKQFLRDHPLCVACEAEGRVRPATQVDHITPHRGDPVLFWDSGNHQPLCASHHSRKTCLEDGGFGRRRKTRD